MTIVSYTDGIDSSIGLIVITREIKELRNFFHWKDLSEIP